MPNFSMLAVLATLAFLWYEFGQVLSHVPHLFP